MKRQCSPVIASALAVAMIFVCLTTTAGAASTSHQSGTVIGTFRIIGGPPPGLNLAIQGTVIFIPKRSTQGLPVKVAVNATGRFVVRLRPGTWTATASSPHDNHNEHGVCGALHPVVVELDKSTRVAVLCEVP